MYPSDFMFRRAPAWVLLALLLPLASCKEESLPPYPLAYREYAYVTNGKSNTVSVIDVLNFRVIKDISVGRGPTGVAENPKKNEVYVVNTESANVSVIDAESNRVVATIGVEGSPYFIDVSPDGKRGYVANAASNNVSVIDLELRKVITTVPVGAQPGLAHISPDGDSVVVPNRSDDTVSILDARKQTVRATVAVCASPVDVEILPDSSKAFVACSGDPEAATSPIGSRGRSRAKRHGTTTEGIAVIDLTTDKLLTLLTVGHVPVDLALKPDGGELFVSDFGNDSMSTIETNTNEVASTRPIGGKPVRGLVSADSALLYVSNFGSDTVSVYSPSISKFLTAIHVGQGPDAMALQPARNGKQYFLLVVDSKSDDVAIVFIKPDTPAWTLFTMLPVGREPRQIVIKAFMLRRPPER